MYGADWSSPGFVAVERYNAGQVRAATDETDGGSTLRGAAHARYSAPLGSSAALQATGWIQASTWELFLNLPGHDGGGQTREEDERVGGGVEVELTRPLGSQEVTFGLAARADDASYMLDDSEARRVIGSEVALEGRQLLGSAYGRWRRTAGRIGLDFGGRVDALDRSSLDRLDTEAARTSAGSVVLSPKAGARYAVTSDVALLTSLSRGFRNAVGVLGDPDRPPILAWAGEVGADLRRGPVEATLALFRLDVSNERTLDPVTRSISSAGESVRQGLDARARLQLARRLSLHAAATWNDARLTGRPADAHEEPGGGAAVPAGGGAEAGAIKKVRGSVRTAHDEPDLGERVPGVARYTGFVGAEAIPTDGLETSATLRFTGAYAPIGEPDIRTRAHAILDLAAGLELGRGARLELELQNALGARYPELRASGFVTPGDPRTLRAALRLETPGT
ncbi:MAG: TonB-dependent receptor [Gemmatimonadetes bacterium]|nr:TonB-dependent receptor [Gemmatimonadota bacterium]